LDGETARLQRLLDDLAGLHNQVLGRLELNREAIQLNDWLSGTISPWEAAAREKGLIWNTEIPAGLPIMTMDLDRMAQAIGNLLSNAIKFTPSGGKVTIMVKFVNEQLMVEVMDTGPGIPMDEQKKIFQPFYRGAHGRRIVQGMGLGLSIAHDIVLAHGGEIELKSAPDTGSHFTLRIPVEIPRKLS
jgi:two-component system sensor histidine kinase BaeS